MMLEATARSTPAFSVGQVKADFRCICCGAETLRHHFLDVRGICPECCPDHDYEYDRYDRGHFCKRCDQQAPRDWYDVE